MKGSIASAAVGCGVGGLITVVGYSSYKEYLDKYVSAPV